MNPDATPEMYEVKADKVAALEVKQDGIENPPAPKKELSVRAKKPKPGERHSKGDGSVVLVRLLDADT
jgi:nuclear pore complex protein Nup133